MEQLLVRSDALVHEYDCGRYLLFCFVNNGVWRFFKGIPILDIPTQMLQETFPLFQKLCTYLNA